MGLKVERRCSLYPAISSVTRPVVATQCLADRYLQCQCQVFRTASSSIVPGCARRAASENHRRSMWRPHHRTERHALHVFQSEYGGVPAQIRLHDMTNALAPVSVKTLYALSSIEGKLSVSCTATILGFGPWHRKSCGEPVACRSVNTKGCSHPRIPALSSSCYRDSVWCECGLQESGHVQPNRRFLLAATQSTRGEHTLLLTRDVDGTAQKAG